MIVLTNLHGEQLAVNDDLRYRVEGDHENRVVRTGVTHSIAAEPLDEVVRRRQEHRAEILALSPPIHLPPPPPEPDTSPDGGGAELHLVREDRRGSVKGGR